MQRLLRKLQTGVGRSAWVGGLLGSGTQACGYGTCYAKYTPLDDFLAQLHVNVEPYTNQRIDWTDSPPVGAGTITSVERENYRQKVTSAAPAAGNYVNAVLDPANWWPPSNTAGDDGGVRADWTMPSCVGFWWPDCQGMVLAAAGAAHAYVTPTVSVATAAVSDYSMLPGAVLAQSPWHGSTGRFTAVTLDANPDPLNGWPGGGGFDGGGDDTTFAGGECDFPHYTGASWEGMIAAHPDRASAFEEACLEAWEVFDSAGGLDPAMVGASRVIIAGRDLQNQEVVQLLTQNNVPITEWAKMATPKFQSSNGPFEVHFYKHLPTGRVEIAKDFKAVFDEVFVP